VSGKCLQPVIRHKGSVPARFSSHILGPFVLWMARREERRLAAGKT
jgi:hypothetical protein